MKFYGLITVRTGSSRLKKKCLLKFGNSNVIQHIIKRSIKGNIIPIVCTTRNKNDDIIVKIAKKLNVKYFRDHLKIKLKDGTTVLKFNVKYFHTIDADDPFFDDLAVKNSIKKIKDLKCDIVFPSKISRDGAASEGYSFSFNGIEKLQNLIKKITKI